MPSREPKGTSLTVFGITQSGDRTYFFCTQSHSDLLMPVLSSNRAKAGYTLHQFPAYCRVQLFQFGIFFCHCTTSRLPPQSFFLYILCWNYVRSTGIRWCQPGEKQNKGDFTNFANENKCSFWYFLKAMSLSAIIFCLCKLGCRQASIKQSVKWTFNLQWTWTWLIETWCTVWWTVSQQYPVLSNWSKQLYKHKFWNMSICKTHICQSYTL